MSAAFFSLTNAAAALADATAPAQMAEKFVLFGKTHLFILFLTVALPLMLSAMTRRRDRPQLARWLALALAVIMILERAFALYLGVHYQRLEHWSDGLPMHLCDWASFAVIIALIWGKQQVYELAYFWGLAGTAQAILTPDLTENIPSPFFFSFFIEHCGIIVAVLFMTWGLHRRPSPGAVWRALGWNQVYLVCAALVNWCFKTNFGYLAAKPKHASLLDLFPPWPWYILVLEVAALLLYLFFYAPFWIGDLRRQNNRSATSAGSVMGN